MTREEAIDIIKCLAWHRRPSEEDIEQAIKVLKQESTTKNNLLIEINQSAYSQGYVDGMKAQAEPKTGHCKECKWWKDSDGAYRRGVEAESQCPINSKKVFEGNGYCYMFEPQESEEV